MVLWNHIVSVVLVVLIGSIALFPLAQAEESVATTERIPVSLTTPDGIEGNYTANLANLSSIPLATEGFGSALALLGFESAGIYIGAYQAESLFEWDYEPPAPISPFAGQIEAGWMPTIYSQYKALESGLEYARMYASVSTLITLDSSVIAEGVSSCVVRVPVPYSGIVPQPPAEGGAPAFLQITRIDDGESYITISGIPTITDGRPYLNTVTVNDRQYMHVTAPLLADTEYEFRYFWSLQGVEYDGTYKDIVSPRVYYTGEDIFGNGANSTLSLGFAHYNITTGRFEITNETAYGGEEITVQLDAGWSIMAIEGMGYGLWGQRIDTSDDREYIFHPTVEISEDNSTVSLYIPFVSDGPVRVSTIEIYDNNPDAIWIKPNGADCVGDYRYYWSATEDCDGDGYVDSPNLNFTDFILITSRTLIQPCSKGNESTWTVHITFADDYDIVLLCSEGSAVLRGGGTSRTGGELPEGIATQWDVDHGGEWYTYNSAPFVHLHLTGNLSYSYYNASANGNDAYSYPHFLRYALGFLFGSFFTWIEVNESVFQDALGFEMWANGPEPSKPLGGFWDLMYNLVIAGGGVIGSLTGYIWDAITWIGSQMEELGQWLWRGILSIYDAIMVVVEAIINVMSYVIEFGIIAVTLLVFFGAIIIWNKILMILRNALKRATKSMEAGI